METTLAAPVRLTPSEVRQLSRIAPGRTPFRALAEVGVVVLVAAAMERSRAFALYPLAALLIASRQHSLLVLMHDCVHHRATRTRWLNDLLGELICWPFLMTMFGYRRHHRRHHVERALNTFEDPDFARVHREGWRFPMRRSRLALLLLKDLLLLNLPELLREARDARNNAVESRSEAAWMGGRIVFTLGGAAALVLCGGWKLYLLYWLVPSLTCLKALLRIRAFADHFGLPDRSGVEPARTVIAPWWERVLLAPGDIGFHHVHHIHPSIPHYRLREAHQRLSSRPSYLARVRVSSSYWRVLMHECCPAQVRS
jgi:fatty acid desaturase